VDPVPDPLLLRVPTLDIFLMMLGYGTAVSPLERMTRHILFNNVWFSLQPACLKLHNEEKYIIGRYPWTPEGGESKPIALGILEKNQNLKGRKYNKHYNTKKLELYKNIL
jgi:hypothetical protein